MRFNDRKIYKDERNQLISVVLFILVIAAMTALVNLANFNSLVPEVNAKERDTLGISTER